MQKFLALLSTALLLVLGMMFSAVLLVFVVTIGLIGLVYLWWKTRALRKLLRTQRQAANDAEMRDDFSGEIIEGEIIEGEITRKVIRLEAPRTPPSP